MGLSRDCSIHNGILEFGWLKFKGKDNKMFPSSLIRISRGLGTLQSGIEAHVMTLQLLWERNVNESVCQELATTLDVYGLGNWSSRCSYKQERLK